MFRSPMLSKRTSLEIEIFYNFAVQHGSHLVHSAYNWTKKIKCYFETGSQYVALAGLDLTEISLPLPPKAENKGIHIW